MVQPKYTKIKGYYGGNIIVIVCDIMGYNIGDFMAIYITINNCDLTNAHTHTWWYKIMEIWWLYNGIYLDKLHATSPRT